MASDYRVRERENRQFEVFQAILGIITAFILIAVMLF